MLTSSAFVFICYGPKLNQKGKSSTAYGSTPKSSGAGGFKIYKMGYHSSYEV